MHPKSGSDPQGVIGGIALKPALAPDSDQLLKPGYTTDAFGRSSSRAFETSSASAAADEFLDFHSHVEPISKLRLP